MKSLTPAEAAESIRSGIRQVRRKAITDPVWFARNVLNLRALKGEHTLASDPMRSWELDGWQVELLEAVGDVIRKGKGLPTKVNHKGLNQITVRAMHGPGKTFGIAALMHWFGFCFHARIACVAPKQNQLKTRLWPEFRKIRLRSRPGYRELMRIFGEQIKWIDQNGQFEDGPFASQETASAPENLQGIHHTYLLVVVDEATGVGEQFWPALFGAISAGVYVIMVTISNPTKTTGTFADSHLKPEEAADWYRIHIKLDQASRVSRKWVETMVRKYGKDSPVVKVRCYGEFAAEDENQLLSMEWIDAAINREFAEDGSIPRQRISVDVADGGENFTVLTHGVHYQSVLRLKTQQQHSFAAGRSHVETAAAVVAMWEAAGMSAENGDDIVVDSVGVGSGVASILVNAGYPVILYKGGARSDDPDMYRNRRVQSYMVLRDYFRDDMVVFDDDFVDTEDWNDLIAQLCSIRRKTSTERLEDLMTKQEMINKKIVSPDRADSIAMQMATQVPEMAVGEADFIVIPGLAESFDGGLA